MIRVALVGAGKMGISHLSILAAHPDVELVGVADPSKIVTDMLQKYSSFRCFPDYKKMMDATNPDAVFVAAPTKFHGDMTEDLVKRGIHLFVEKPFCLDVNKGEQLVKLAKQKGIINQVGYHNKFIGTFTKAQQMLESGNIGDLYHFIGEAYGPVVIRKKQSTWRSNPEEGGGCLLDYACHVVDLINFLIAPVKSVNASVLKSVYSENVEDSVYSLLELENKVSGILSVNWSDETYRKMSTTITVLGNRGKIIVDSTELKVYFKDDHCPPGFTKGWNIKYLPELNEDVEFYLRGEEYSLQIDYFIKAILGQVENNKNTFESSWITDKAISKIRSKNNN